MCKNGDKCPICGVGILKKKIIEEIFNYKGETIKIKNYIIYECDVCEEAIVDRKTMRDTSRPLKEFRKNVDDKVITHKV